MPIYSVGKVCALDGRGSKTVLTIVGGWPPRLPLTVVRPSDHFGKYVLTLGCKCGHKHPAPPQTPAGLAGWYALLSDVVRRLRCSPCGRQRCSAMVRPETKRKG